MVRQFLMGGSISICNITIHALVMTAVVRTSQATVARVFRPTAVHRGAEEPRTEREDYRTRRYLEHRRPLCMRASIPLAEIDRLMNGDPDVITGLVERLEKPSKDVAG